MNRLWLRLFRTPPRPEFRTDGLNARQGQGGAAFGESSETGPTINHWANRMRTTDVCLTLRSSRLQESMRNVI
jgi:hypothetical protein